MRSKLDITQLAFNAVAGGRFDRPGEIKVQAVHTTGRSRGAQPVEQRVLLW